MKKSHRKQSLLSLLCLSLFCALFLSGCGHYKRGEAAEWFQEEIADETLAVSEDYTERENEEGYTDRVWSAHLKKMPDVEFELVSHAYYSLFMSYQMETDYHLRMGRYYLDRYLEEHPDALEGFEIEADAGAEELTFCAVYDSPSEISGLCRDIQRLDDYLAMQDYPCCVNYQLSFRESLTLPKANLEQGLCLPRTRVLEEGGNRNTEAALAAARKQDPSDSSVEGPLTLSVSEALQKRAESAFAEYAAVYRVDMDLCTEEELADAVRENSPFRFTITRPDGSHICYPELLLAYTDSMSFGCLYEVLVREGAFDVSGTPEAFTFTAADGTDYSFSYSYRTAVSQPSREDGEGCEADFFYCLSGEDGEKILLDQEPIIDEESFRLLTGCGFEPIDG